MMVAGILGWAAIIWYILARKNPKKFAPFLKAPYGNKRGYIFIVLFLVTGFIGMAINPPATMSQKSNNQIVSNKSVLQTELTISDTQEKSIMKTLSQIGIQSIKSIKLNPNLLVSEQPNVKGYNATDDNGVNFLLYLTPDFKVYRAAVSGSALYENGQVIQNIQDCTFKGNEKSTLRQIAEKITKQQLKAPSTAKFPSISEYSFSKDKGIATVKGYVDAQNSFGAMIRTSFIMTYDVKNDKLVNYQAF